MLRLIYLTCVKTVHDAIAYAPYALRAKTSITRGYNAKLQLKI